MSTFHFVTEKCAVCGKEHDYNYGSTNTFGAPDLDGRPSEMKRSTMGRWIHECPYCGYIARSVSQQTNIDPKYLKSLDYTGCDGQKFIDVLAQRYYKYYKISALVKDIPDAYFAIRCCAWACDDAGDDENAMVCREIAVSLTDELIDERDDEQEKEELLLIKADLLRRSKHFDKVISEFSNTIFDDDCNNKIIQFQISRSKECDFGCYTIRDADRDYNPPYRIYL